MRMTQIPGLVTRAIAHSSSLALMFLTNCAVAGDDFRLYLPSTRWIIMSSPWHPTSADECKAFAQEFQAEVTKLSEQHEECLQGAGREPAGSDGCSKASCQALHSAMNGASKKSNEESSLCYGRLSEYQAEKRREDDARRKSAQAADRIAQERQRDEADRNTKREAERNKEAADHRERDALETKTRSERDAQTAKEQARREQEARRDAKAQAIREKEAEKKKGMDELEESRYAELLKELTAGALAAKRLSAVAKNPFEAGGRYLGRALDKSLLDAGLDASIPLGDEKHDANYDDISTGVNTVRATALKSNPFAQEISGLAMRGIDKVNRQVLGQADELGETMAQFGKDDMTRPAMSTSASRSSSPSRIDSAPPTSPTTNPAPITPVPDQIARMNPNIKDRANPFANGSRAASYRDADSGHEYSIPTGHTLYRDPSNGELSVVHESHAVVAAEEDRLVNGHLRCSKSGSGRVIAECEQRRKRRNPF